MTFKIVPAVHAESGALVDYPEGGPAGDALKGLAREHGEVYVVDVAGVRRNRPDVDFLKDNARFLPVWVDAGSRYATDAMDALVAGASRLSVRWNTLHHPRELDELGEIGDPGTFFLSLEFTDEGFLPNSKDRQAAPDAIARAALDRGIGLVVSSWVFDPAMARRFAGEGPERWWYGALKPDEALELRRLGYAGVVVPAPLAADLAHLKTPEGGEEAASP